MHVLYVLYANTYAILTRCIACISLYWACIVVTIQHNTHVIWTRCIACIGLYWNCQYRQNTCKYKPIQTQYEHDGALFCDRHLLRIGMYLYVFCMYLVCIGVYLLVLGGVADHRKGPRCIACIACISMYLCVLCMYWYVFCVYYIVNTSPILMNTSFSPIQT